MNNLILMSLGLAGSLWTSQAQAQKAVSNWPITRLDSVASVEMPYEGTVDDTEAKNGLCSFGTSTSDNNFDVLIYQPHPNQPAQAGKMWTINVNKFLALAMQLPNNNFARPKLKTSFYVTVPTAPEGRAMHQVYSGFDEVHQSPATLELTWVLVGQKLYVFRCSYQLPAEQGSTEDMQHFFTTIHFKLPRP
ncbi:MAG: hypothetical protein EOO57_02720 [Hymenobacter sp.]|nr:MAG: hypothetical protein EOO57_02720 [Hymenobacter sp.]